ncbi:hypothetical protein [Bacteroides sp.]|uniref:hypothetical protein n=1 Tax=Bacteroides sp. TaxID=29523 RepID=UPI0026349C30|nr:hypothetical protein [Bacteroides sp.]
MRKHLLFALLGMAAMFIGCSQEENAITPSGSKTVSFTIAVNDGVDTRAVTEPTVKPTRYIMEVYEGTTSKDAVQATQVEQAEGTFDVILKDGQDYTILFWADYGTAKGSDNVFDASKLREVKIATGKVATKAAFAGVAKFKVGTDDATKYTAVTLSHAVAQVNFKQTTTLSATPGKLTVKYPESYSLNVEGYTVAKIDGAVTHELTCNAVTTGVIATDYIIATNDDQTLMNIEATLDSETKKDISNAPFRRNYSTNISGKYSDKNSATLTVSCDDTWAGDLEPEEESWYVKGKATGNFEIGTAKELRELAGLTNGDPTTLTTYGEYSKLNFSGKTITLTADIDLEEEAWIPIGNTSSAYFSGSFNGNGKTISGLNVNTSGGYSGFFGFIFNGSVRNLHIEGGTVTDNSQYAIAGGIVGAASNTIIENCSSSAVVSAENKGLAGGIVGTLSGNQQGLTKIVGCYATGNITGTTVGGICGNSTVGIQACYYNGGTLTQKGAVEGDNVGIGGIIGLISEPFSGPVPDILNCYASATFNSATINIGGIIGGIAETFFAMSSDNINYCVHAISGITAGVGNQSSWDVSKSVSNITDEISWLNTNLPGAVGYKFKADGTLEKVTQ